MTKGPNPSQIPMTKLQIPKAEDRHDGALPFRRWDLVIGAGDFIGIWALGHWEFAAIRLLGRQDFSLQQHFCYNPRP